MSRVIRAAVAVTLALTLNDPQSTFAQTGPSWIGTRAVQTHKDFALQQEGQPGDRTKNAVYIYVVERSKDTLVWIRAEGKGPSGWADRAELVPIEEAIEFFTERIRANPHDAFSHFMRARIWLEKKESDKAIADYTEAIRFDPKDAGAYRNRGHAWNDKKEYDKAIADYTEAIRLDPSDARSRAHEQIGAIGKASANLLKAARLGPD
jgi:tetratricopeptide (TPR) repeat protein